MRISPFVLRQSRSDQIRTNGKPQFSIAKIMLWTAIVAGGLAITTVTLAEYGEYDSPFFAALHLSAYLLVVCGLWSLVRNPKSFDFWFPAGMTVFGPGFLFMYTVAVPVGGTGDDLLQLISLVAVLVGVPYGIYLLVLTVRRTMRQGLSLTMLVYHLGSWLWWMVCSVVAWFEGSGAMR